MVIILINVRRFLLGWTPKMGLSFKHIPILGICFKTSAPFQGSGFQSTSCTVSVHQLAIACLWKRCLMASLGSTWICLYQDLLNISKIACQTVCWIPLDFVFDNAKVHIMKRKNGKSGSRVGKSGEIREKIGSFRDFLPDNFFDAVELLAKA